MFARIGKAVLAWVIFGLLAIPVASAARATLVSIVITPSSASAQAGTKVQFSATGTYSNGSKQDITNTVKWTSSNTAVATVNPAGTATAVAAGTATISASLSRVNASAALTVTARTLQSIAVTPADSSIPLGTNEQLTATGTYSDGSTQNLSFSVTWTSTSTNTATIGSTGLATSHGIGSTTITATSGGISGQANLNITSAVLSSISVTAPSGSLALGTTEQFTATGTFTDGTTQDISASVAWISSVPSVATIGLTGIATPIAQGVTSISASSGAVQSNSKSLTVLPAALQFIAVSPVGSSIAAGLTQQFTATGTYSDGSTQDITATVTWQSDTSTVARISASGVATAASVGAANISATSGSISGSTSLTVTPAQLVSIAITPAIPSIPLGSTQQFAATGTYTDGSTQDLTATAHWSSSNSAVATVSNSIGTYGVATSGATGNTTIAASLGSVSGSTILTVTPAQLQSISISPANPSIVVGSSQHFSATGTYSDSTTVDLTSTATWSSDTSAVATVNSSGLAQGVSTGSAGITAAVGSISGTTSLAVSPAPLVSITVSPSTASIPLGTTQAFQATGNYADGSQQVLTSSVHWSTSDLTVATVSNAAGTYGLASTVAPGSVTVTATSGTISGTASLAVTPAALVSITLAPINPTIALGTAQQFTATGKYSDGSTKNITTNVSWTSSAAVVAVISNNNGSQGLATSSGVGSTTITAAMSGISASTTLSVGAAQLTSITVTPLNPSIPRGMSQQFIATGTYTNGSTADVTSSVVWSSSNTSVAAISAGGSATGTNPGTTTITAALGSVAGSTTLIVSAPIITGVNISPATPSIALGVNQQFTATAVYSDASTQNVTSLAAWTSSTSTVATINSAGLATSVNYGMTTITAAYSGMSAQTTLTVQSSGLVSVTLPVDLGTPLNVSSKTGSALTATMLNTGTIASDCTVGSSCSWTTAGSAFTVGPSQSGCSNIGLVSIRSGSTYGAGAWNNDSLAFDSTKTLNTSSLSLPGNITSVSALFCAVMGMSASPYANLFDMFVIEDLGGYYAVLPQLMTSCGGISGNFGVNIEGKSSAGATVHSSCIKLTQGATYWFAANYNSAAGTASLYVYTAAGSPVGNVSLSNLKTGNPIYDLRIGNNETGTFTGTTYFQNLMVDWTNHAVPLFW